MSTAATLEVLHPNRDKPESKTTKAAVILLLVASAGLIAVVTAGGWSKLQGGQFIQLFYVATYAALAFFVSRWNRGVLPVAAAMAIVLTIVALAATPAWFTRDKPGFEAPAFPDDLMGLLTLLIVPVQIALVVFSVRGFGQQWQVEEGAGADPSKRARV